MGWSKKKPDPISDRARALNEQIAALEAQIKQLDARLAEDKATPRLRPATVPQGSAVPAPVAPPAPSRPKPTEPIFEEVDQARLKDRHDSGSTPEHYNDLGIRKYDLAALINRVKNHFRSPSTTNPKLVSYLAAGSIQGLRPMRYEKRVARNRFLFFASILLLLLFGLVTWALHYGRH